MSITVQRVNCSTSDYTAKLTNCSAELIKPMLTRTSQDCLSQHQLILVVGATLSHMIIAPEDSQPILTLTMGGIYKGVLDLMGYADSLKL